VELAAIGNPLRGTYCDLQWESHYRHLTALGTR